MGLQGSGPGTSADRSRRRMAVRDVLVAHLRPVQRLRGSGVRNHDRAGQVRRQKPRRDGVAVPPVDVLPVGGTPYGGSAWAGDSTDRLSTSGGSLPVADPGRVDVPGNGVGRGGRVSRETAPGVLPMVTLRRPDLWVAQAAWEGVGGEATTFGAGLQVAIAALPGAALPRGLLNAADKEVTPAMPDRCGSSPESQRSRHAGWRPCPPEGPHCRQAGHRPEYGTSIAPP
jgi:hypothetical protein